MTSGLWTCIRRSIRVIRNATWCCVRGMRAGQQPMHRLEFFYFILFFKFIVPLPVGWRPKIYTKTLSKRTYTYTNKSITKPGRYHIFTLFSEHLVNVQFNVLGGIYRAIAWMRSVLESLSKNKLLWPPSSIARCGQGLCPVVVEFLWSEYGHFMLLRPNSSMVPYCCIFTERHKNTKFSLNLITAGDYEWKRHRIE